MKKVIVFAILAAAAIPGAMLLVAALVITAAFVVGVCVGDVLPSMGVISEVAAALAVFAVGTLHGRIAESVDQECGEITN